MLCARLRSTSPLGEASKFLRFQMIANSLHYSTFQAKSLDLTHLPAGLTAAQVQKATLTLFVNVASLPPATMLLTGVTKVIKR